MENLNILMAGLTAIILFVFGLEHFSKEIERLSGERFRKSLARATRLPIVGLVIGAVVTAVIQSSSATSVIAISLVNAGVLSFQNSVGIIFGANIGTTITAQLVAFKLTAFAPILIILGFFMSLLRNRFSVFGKAIFYFGFVFFSLNLISITLQPLQHNPQLVALLTQPKNPLLAILFGCLFTALVQSSSVTTGLAIIFTQQGILGLENAVPLIMGANIGTTATALIAMFNMDGAAKKAALSHFIFNFGGVMLFVPLLFIFGHRLSTLTMDPAVALANIHLVFNVVTSVVFLAFVKPFTRLIEWLVGEGKMDFERLPLPAWDGEEPFETICSKLDVDSQSLLGFLQENYNLVTLSIESNYRSISDAAEKRIQYIEFFKKETTSYFSQIVAGIKDQNASRAMIRQVNQYDYLFQIHDSIQDLFNLKRVLDDQYIELKSDILLLIRELSSHTLGLFDDLKKGFEQNESPDIPSLSGDMQNNLEEAHRDLLTLLADPGRRDAGVLTNFVTYSQRLKDKLINYALLKKKAVKLDPVVAPPQVQTS